MPQPIDEERPDVESVTESVLVVFMVFADPLNRVLSAWIRRLVQCQALANQMFTCLARSGHFFVNDVPVAARRRCKVRRGSGISVPKNRGGAICPFDPHWTMAELTRPAPFGNSI